MSPPDALFALLKLFAEPACSLSNILTPLSFSPSSTDYSLPWHLYVLLSRSMRVRDLVDRGDPGVDMMNEDDIHIEGHSPSADLLTNSYAFQLEQLGMIQEAVFVLLHIEGSAGYLRFVLSSCMWAHLNCRREKAIKELLSRSAPKLDVWTTRGIVGSLKIPMSWVNEVQV
jgi:nuclear pore complex protein Nup98-Nup96